MARPSRLIDRALLDSGRQLYAQLGCAGLSVRTLADHAGVNQAMFHYHFKTKEDFLRMLLQQLYEEMFGALSAAAQQQGNPVQRLGAALATLARFARTHRRVLARVWTDAMSEQPVARDFFARNAPRHIGLLLMLLEQAQAAGELRVEPPLQRFSFIMGSVMLPIIFLGGLIEATGKGGSLLPGFEQQVLSDAAIEARVELAIAALRPAVTKRRTRGLRGARVSAGAAAGTGRAAPARRPVRK